YGTTFNNSITSANIIDVAGGSLSATGPITIPKLRISGGGLVGSIYDISIPTSFDWAGGTLSGSGNTILGGMSTITGAVTLARPITNNGTLAMSGAGAITM